MTDVIGQPKTDIGKEARLTHPYTSISVRLELRGRGLAAFIRGDASLAERARVYHDRVFVSLSTEEKWRWGPRASARAPWTWVVAVFTADGGGRATRIVLGLSTSATAWPLRSVLDTLSPRIVLGLSTSATAASRSPIDRLAGRVVEQENGSPVSRYSRCRSRKKRTSLSSLGSAPTR